MAGPAGRFVGQEVVQLSTMPVLRDGRLEPAPFVLRVFAAFTPEGSRSCPAASAGHSDRMDVRAISMGEGGQHRRRLGDRRQAGGAAFSRWPAART
jgi:uncharacterized circularly permuted ATP-grasp superfamily protein